MRGPLTITRDKGMELSLGMEGGSMKAHLKTTEWTARGSCSIQKGTLAESIHLKMESF